MLLHSTPRLQRSALKLKLRGHGRLEVAREEDKKFVFVFIQKREENRAGGYGGNEEEQESWREAMAETP